MSGKQFLGRSRGSCQLEGVLKAVAALILQVVSGRLRIMIFLTVKERRSLEEFLLTSTINKGNMWLEQTNSLTVRAALLWCTPRDQLITPSAHPRDYFEPTKLLSTVETRL
jgi:hypothetical protein